MRASPVARTAGVRVLFGESKESNGRYVVIVDVTQNRVGLFHQAEGGAVTTLVDYLPIDAADQQGGINHVSLQVVGGQLRVNLNGKDILQHAGLKVVEGQVSIGAISWDGGPRLSSTTSCSWRRLVPEGQ